MFRSSFMMTLFPLLTWNLIVLPQEETEPAQGIQLGQVAEASVLDLECYHVLLERTTTFHLECVAFFVDSPRAAVLGNDGDRMN